MRTKHEVIEDALKEYLRASKHLKKEILDRLEKVTGMNRKSIIRRLRVLQLRKEGYDWHDHRGRPVYYTPDVVAALYEVWEISHELCAERLHPILGEYVSVLMRDDMWSHSDEATGKLRAMSLGRMKEFTQSFDKVISGGGRCMTKPSSLKEVIPVRRGPWENPPPGYGEVDTVAHCGNSIEGEFAWTVQYSDISILWCFLEAQMGRGGKETLASVQAMEKRSPHTIRGLDPDSGGEFINWALHAWSVKKKIELTRIRPGMKNDHGRIEQKNDKNVRKWAGYIRVDTEERLVILKELYKVLEVYINHFLPSMKCIGKVRYNISHSSRKYDEAKTPYQRFMEHPDINPKSKEKLEAFHRTLNPKTLHDELLRLRKKLFAGAKFTRNDI
ncbi:MAG: hypothetical protein P4L61_02275 [Candidatus Pacebacteria bacterium]|nr:hypothetical protein [Candidatus Paceibacterota bacterium]